MNLIVLTLIDVFSHIKHISCEILHLKYLKLGQNFGLKSSIQLIRGTTYTRVYTFGKVT
jgi:hypothetical protein